MGTVSIGKLLLNNELQEKVYRKIEIRQRKLDMEYFLICYEKIDRILPKLTYKI